MNPFQFITLPLVGLLLARSILIFLQGRRPRSVAMLGVAIWFLAGVAILNPDVTIRVAALFGIGRGADLVLYILVIAFLISAFFFYHKFQELESDVTEIVRQLAIHEALQHRTQSDAAEKDAQNEAIIQKELD